MKVAILTHFYPPEACAAATRVQSLADALRHAGNEVTVITAFPSFPNGRLRPEDRWKIFERTQDGRCATVRLPSVVARMPGARLIHWLTSGASFALYALFTRERYDAVVVSTPPITLAFPAIVAAWRHRAKLAVDVRDVFPDIAIAMGEWRRDGFLARATEYVVRKLYHRADLVVAVTPTALEQIASRGVHRSRLALARNAAEEVPSISRPARNGKPFRAIYAGNLGLATDVDVLLNAAARLKDDGVCLEIAGGGALADAVRDRVHNEGLHNVILSGVLARREALEHIAAADIALVPLRAGITESVPTKLYDALSVGTPVIVTAGGEAAEEGAVLGARCTRAGDDRALAEAIRAFASMDKTELVELAERGRIAVQERSSRAAIMAELSRRISSL